MSAESRVDQPLVTQRRLFILLGLLAAVVVLAVKAHSLVVERDQILTQRQAQAGTLAQFAATYSARLYDQSARVAREVADYIHRERPDPAELQRYLASRAADTIIDDYIVVVDAQGSVRATSQGLPTKNISFADLQPPASWVAGKPQIVPVMRSRLTGSIIYSLSQRLEDEAGRYAGVVGVNVRPEGVRPTSARRPEDPILSVWSQNGQFIAASFVDFDASGRAIPPPRPGGLGTARSTPAGGKRASIAALEAVQGWPVFAVASFDKDGVLATWRRNVYEAAGLMAVVIAGIGILVVVGVKTADREAWARRELLEANAAKARALEERDLLMREIHHRVKNSLMMTSSLLNLQGRRFHDPEVREAFAAIKGQLHSIGLVHEALYNGSSLEAVDVQAYLERLLGELAKAYGSDARRIALNLVAEPLLLAPHQTTPLGLIVAEGVTNAFKHAFGAEGDGQITVQVRLANPDEILLEIRDDGEGYRTVASSTETGLGSRLIEALAHQLGGTIALSNEGGAAFRLTFPRGGRHWPSGAALAATGPSPHAGGGGSEAPVDGPQIARAEL